MRRPLSLASRLTLLFGFAAAIIFAVFGEIISRSMEAHFEAGDTSELNIISSTVIDALSSARTEDEVSQLSNRFDDILVGHHSASLYIAETDGMYFYENPGPDLTALIKHAVGGSEETGVPRIWQDEEHHYRVLVQTATEEHTDKRYAIVVAVPIDFHLQFLGEFRTTLWIMIATGIATMCVMGWVAARRGHAPLHDIVRRIRQISANELDNRLSAETLPVELSDLAYSFNDMLQRVDDSFQRLIDFNADIAHELRTPVTNLLTQTQVALSRDRSEPEYREILYSNIEEYDRMAQMVSDMLFLAKADDGLSANEITEIQLDNELMDLGDYYEGWAEERGVSLSIEGTATVLGDRQMLRRAFGNLLTNAIRHTPAGNVVRTIIAPSSQGKIGITIENPGTEIASEHLTKIFDRFYRVDPARRRDGDGEGAGLGLAIVKTIINAHHGHIQVSSTEKSTRFKVLLPSHQ